MLHDSPSKLLKTARLSYKEAGFGWLEEGSVENEDVPGEEEEKGDDLEEVSVTREIFESESVISQESAKKNDLSLLGVELDEDTISRLESNLGQSLFMTAQKAAGTIRVSSAIRHDFPIQTPMGGHLVDESFMRFTNDQNNEISMVSAPKAASPAPAYTSAAGVPKSMRMSASFQGNRDTFLPLASGVDEEMMSDISSDEKARDEDHEEAISLLGINVVDAIERSISKIGAAEEANAVNTSLDYYRKKRSIFRNDLNQIVGDNDCSGEDEIKRGAEHAYLKEANASAAFTIEPEMRPEVDKLLLALQVDYMSNPDRFVRRLFGFPLNAPRVSMKVVQQLRFVGETTFFDTMRKVLRAKEPSDKVRSHADVKMENELIWSLFQLVVEKRRLSDEKDPRPVVDLWEFVRNLKTGNRLRALYKEGRPVTKEEIELFQIRSNFLKLDKTNEPQPSNPYRVNALEREVKKGNAEIQRERQKEGSVAWRNKSPPRRGFDNEEGKGLHQISPRPSDTTMLQVLNHNTTKGQRVPIDNEMRLRKFAGVAMEFPTAKNESGLMRSVLSQDKSPVGQHRNSLTGGNARRKYIEKSHPTSKGMHELLHVDDWKPDTSRRTLSSAREEQMRAKDIHPQTKVEQERRYRPNVLRPAWTGSSVSDALHGNYDTSAKNHLRGTHLSQKAIHHANKSGEREKQVKSAQEKVSRRGSVTNVGPARETLKAVQAAEKSASNEVPTLIRQASTSSAASS